MLSRYIVLLITLGVVIGLVQSQSQTINVVPYPQSVTNAWTTIACSGPNSLQITTTSQSITLGVSIKRYTELMFPFGTGNGSTNAITLAISVDSSNEDLFLGVDESYTLDTTTAECTLSAKTIYGAMRGLETFKQLMVYDLNEFTYYLSQATIDDYPRFPWRGFMIDTARHYYPVNSILHIIDSLGYNKYNVLHWHIVDAVSYPFVSTTYPELSSAAYGPKAVYTHADIQQVIAYAKTYGIRVIPEFDIPGHSAAWGIGYPYLVANCPAYAANVNNIPLDISADTTYEFLENLFTEVASLFPDQYFHTGGDEVVLGCWQSDPTIVSWMHEKGFSVVEAETYFESQLDTIMEKINKTKLIWNDPIDNGCDIIKSAIVQIWDSDTDSQKILSDGYKILVSFDWYLDKQDPDGVIHYEWQDTWQDFYAADPYKNITSHTNNILGGEAAMWSEQVSNVNFDVRVWPRAVGIAERLWSAQDIDSVSSALPRIEQFSCDLSRRGVLSGPLTPGDYCPTQDDLTYSLGPVSRVDKDTLLSIYHTF